MTRSGTVISVARVDDDQTSCGRCGQPIERGRRAALVYGAGKVHIRCVAAHDQDDVTTTPTTTTEGPRDQ